MCSCSDNDVDAIHSDVTWTSLLTVRLNQFHFRVGLLSLCFSMSFFTCLTVCIFGWTTKGIDFSCSLSAFFGTRAQFFILICLAFILN